MRTAPASRCGSGAGCPDVPQFTIQGGSKIDIPSAAEIAALVDVTERERWRAVKYMRLPQMSGKAASSALAIGAGAAQVGPEGGYAWVIRRLIVSGMTTGGTPDVANLYVNDSGANQQPLWQFNGNNFGYTFGKGELVINGGEIMLLASVGTFAATGLITLSGSLIEVPAEMLGKIT
jgi:hypothetical protein